MPDLLQPDELRAVDAWWRAANYLTVGQIYLHQNPLLREPLRAEHVKPRLLGHWGTSPGISLVYAHLTRLVRERDVDAILLAGPGHGGPAVHLNGYKIASPTVLGRKPDEEIRALFSGHGYEPRFVEGDQPARVHQDFAAALQWAHDRILDYQGEARGGRLRDRPRWPLIVLRTPKGWTGPRELDGLRIEGTFRSHQVPLAKVREDPRELAMLEAWMRSYRPEELFDERGRPVPQITALAPREDRRLGSNPHANAGRLLRPLEMPDFTRYAVPVTTPGAMRAESTRQLGMMLRDVYRQNPRTFRLFCPDEANSNRLTPVFEVEDRAFAERILPGDDHLSPAGRVMEVLSEHNCEGWLEGYVLTGRHGMFVTYEAFALIVASMATQHAKWLEMCESLPWRKPVASLNVLLTSTCWRNDHNGFSPQGPGFLHTIISKKGTVARAYLPPDANCLLSVPDHCLRTRNYVNLTLTEKQPELQWLDMDAARDHCSR